MSNPVIKNVVISLPNKGNFNVLDVNQKNENLEYLANLICDEIGLTIFDNLTKEEETGNIYFIGYDGDPHAIFCMFVPSINSTTHYYSLEFVDRNDQPITGAYTRTGNDHYGMAWTITNSYLGSYSYPFGFSYIKDDNFFYFLATGSSSYNTKAELFNALNTSRISNNDHKMGYYRNVDNPVKFKAYASYYSLIDYYLKEGSVWTLPQVNKTNLYDLMGNSSNFILDKVYAVLNNEYYELPSKFKAMCYSGNAYPGRVYLIDNKYYVTIFGYSGYQSVIFELSGEPQAG